MNMNQSSAKEFVDRLNEFVEVEVVEKELIAIAPTSVFFSIFSEINFLLAGQDCSQYQRGAYTGDVSAEQLKDMNCSHVLLGHSERRNIYNETNKVVKSKAIQALEQDLTPIICIGETLEQKENGETERVIIDQLSESIPSNIKNFIVAYEPVWSIGTGKLPNIEEIGFVADLISKQLNKLNLFENNIKILYGGSVNSGNCEEIMGIENISGLLVGGASLNVESFIEIIKKIYKK